LRGGTPSSAMLLYCDRVSICGKDRCVLLHLRSMFLSRVHMAHTSCAVARANLSPRRYRFSTRSVRTDILVDIVVLEQLSHQILRFTPVIIIPPVIRARLYACHRRYKILATDSFFVLTNWSL
jgi:hypothetical protein